MRLPLQFATGFVLLTTLVSCGVANRTGETPSDPADRQQTPAPTSRPQPAAPQAVVEGRFGQEVRVGDLGLTMQIVNVGIQSGLDPNGTLAYSDQDHLFIKLVIKNYNPNKMARVSSQRDPKLTDEHGNTYDQVKQMKNNRGRPIATDFAIGNGKIADVRSDREGTDAYVFTPPVPGANTLTLTLDATSYGGTGVIKLTVTRPEWDPKPKPKR